MLSPQNNFLSEKSLVNIFFLIWGVVTAFIRQYYSNQI